MTPSPPLPSPAHPTPPVGWNGEPCIIAPPPTSTLANNPPAHKMDHLLGERVNNKQHLPKRWFFQERLESELGLYLMRGGREEDKEINSDKSSFDVLDLILITNIFAANWSLLSWDSKFTKSRLSSLFVGVIMKLSNFVSFLSDCQILGAPCQCGCQWWVGGGKGWLRFRQPLLSRNLIIVIHPSSNLDTYLPYLAVPRLFLSFILYCFPFRE